MEADEDRELLERLLATSDAPCPSCEYNLRGLKGQHCPECNTPLRLRVGTSHSRLFRRGLLAACVMFALMAWMSAAEFAWYLLGMYGVIGSPTGRGFVRLRTIYWFTVAHTFLIAVLCAWMFIAAWRAPAARRLRDENGWVDVMMRGLIAVLVIDGALGCVTFIWGWLSR